MNTHRYWRIIGYIRSGTGKYFGYMPPGTNLHTVPGGMEFQIQRIGKYLVFVPQRLRTEK